MVGMESTAETVNASIEEFVDNYKQKLKKTCLRFKVLKSLKAATEDTSLKWTDEHRLVLINLLVNRAAYDLKISDDKLMGGFLTYLKSLTFRGFTPTSSRVELATFVIVIQNCFDREKIDNNEVILTLKSLSGYIDRSFSSKPKHKSNDGDLAGFKKFINFFITDDLIEQTVLIKENQSIEVPLDLRVILFKLLASVVKYGLDLAWNCSCGEPCVCVLGKETLTFCLRHYGGSLSIADRCLYSLIGYHQRVGWTPLSLETRPILFGRRAFDHMAMLEKPVLLKDLPSIELALNLCLERRKLMFSVVHYPWLYSGSDFSDDKGFSLSEVNFMDAHAHSRMPFGGFVFSGLVRKITFDRVAPDNLYDPRFLVPLLHQWLESDNVIHSKPFLLSNAFSYNVSALSSLCPRTRTLAMRNIHLFAGHLAQAPKFPEKIHIESLIRVLLASLKIEGVIVRVPSFSACFFARAVRDCMFPGEHAYSHVMGFLYGTSHGKIDIYSGISGFPLKLLEESHCPRSKEDRLWILNLLKDGLRCFEDFQIYERSSIVSVVLSLYSSVTSDCDGVLRVSCLGFLMSAVRIPRVCGVLILYHGVIEFLKQAIMPIGGNSRTVGVKEKSCIHGIVESMKISILILLKEMETRKNVELKEDPNVIFERLSLKVSLDRVNQMELKLGKNE